MSDNLPSPLDAIASLTITLYAGGQVSISGSIGDKQLAITLLSSALDEMRAQVRRSGKPLYIPGSGIITHHDPRYPVKPLGDM